MYLLHITSPTIIPVIISTCCSLCRMEQLLPHFLHSHYLWQVLLLWYLLEYLEVYFQYHNPKAILTGISSVVPSTSRSLLFFFPSALIFPILLNCSPPVLSVVSVQHLVLLSLCSSFSQFLQSSTILYQHLELDVWENCFPKLTSLHPLVFLLFFLTVTSRLLHFTVSKLCFAHGPVKSHQFFPSKTWLLAYIL